MGSEQEQGQALAVFNHATEEIRFFKGQQWRVTNYALLAYAALAAAPRLIERESVGDCVWSVANLGCALVALVTASLAFGVLGSLNKALGKERRRMDKARCNLLLLMAIHNSEPRDRAARYWPCRFRFRRRTQHRADDDAHDPVVCVLRAALVIGLVIVFLINLARVPWADLINAGPEKTTTLPPQSHLDQTRLANRAHYAFRW
jgi:hypothetical protein